MDKKNDFKSKITIVLVTTIIIFLTYYANIFAIRRMAVFAIEANFYDKLAVAYDIGGIGGVKIELSKILKRAGSKTHELKVAKEFEVRLASLNNPEKYIDDAFVYSKQKIILIKNLRIVAMTLLAVIFLINFFSQRRLNKLSVKSHE